MLVDLSDPLLCDQQAFDLYCIPFAGGKPEVFRRWAKQAPASVRVVGMTFPNRSEETMAAGSLAMPQLASALADHIIEAGRTKYGLYGHSLGALVAFETARELRRRGHVEPRILFCGASNAPDRISWRPDVAKLSDRDLLALCRREFGREVAEVEEIGPWERELLRPLRDHLSLLDGYVFAPEPPLNLPILAIAGRHDPSFDIAAVRGWAHHSNRPFELHVVDSGHYFVVDSAEAVLTIVCQQIMAACA